MGNGSERSISRLYLSLADLAGYPIARTWLDKRVHQSYEVIKDKFYPGESGIYGLKVFP